MRFTKGTKQMIINPQFYEKDGGIERGYDVYSRLLKDRVVLLFNEVDDNLACSIIGQLLYLESVDPEKDVYLYINSPGGSVPAGLGIYDTMQHLKCDVSTICVGMAASMGAFLLSSGAKGKRFALPNSEIMIHQVSSGVQGQATDMKIAVEHTLRLKDRLNRILADNTGKPIEQVALDTERDNWMFAKEAQAYGIIDSIIK